MDEVGSRHAKNFFADLNVLHPYFQELYPVICRTSTLNIFHNRKCLELSFNQRVQRRNMHVPCQNVWGLYHWFSVLCLIKLAETALDFISLPGMNCCKCGELLDNSLSLGVGSELVISHHKCWSTSCPFSQTRGLIITLMQRSLAETVTMPDLRMESGLVTPAGSARVQLVPSGFETAGSARGQPVPSDSSSHLVKFLTPHKRPP